MTRRAITALIVTCLISLPAWAGGDIYVATTGNDTTGNGSIGTPYATIAKAITAITDSNGGWNIILRSGTYNDTAANVDFMFAATQTLAAGTYWLVWKADAVNVPSLNYGSTSNGWKYSTNSGSSWYSSSYNRVAGVYGCDPN